MWRARETNRTVCRLYDVLRGHVEHVGDDGDRQRIGEVLDEVDFAVETRAIEEAFDRRLDRAEQLFDQRVEPRAHLLHRRHQPLH